MKYWLVCALCGGLPAFLGLNRKRREHEGNHLQKWSNCTSKIPHFELHLLVRSWTFRVAISVHVFLLQNEWIKSCTSAMGAVTFLQSPKRVMHCVALCTHIIVTSSNYQAQLNTYFLLNQMHWGFAFRMCHDWKEQRWVGSSGFPPIREQSDSFF